MRRILIQFLLFFTLFQVNAQSSVQTQNIRIQPKSQNGLVGSMTVKNVFRNCFGDAFMGYGYKNVNIEYLIYQGEKFYASDLNISSFNSYVILAKGDVDIYRISSGSKILVKSKYLNSMDKNDSFGCYSSGVNIGASEKDNIHNLKAEFKNVEVSYRADLLQTVKKIFTEREKDLKVKSLLREAGQTSDPDRAISILNEAKKYTNDVQIIDDQIEYIHKSIPQNKEDVNYEAVNSKTNYIGNDVTSSNMYMVSSSSSSESDVARQLRIQREELEALQEKQRLEQESFDQASMIAAQQIQSGNYAEAGFTFAQEFANQGNVAATAVTAGAGIIGQIIGDASEAKKRREAAERAQMAELARKRAIERNRIELLERQKNEFEIAANKQIEFYKSIIESRTKFVSEKIEHTKLYDKFSMEKEPIYLFYAVVNNDYNSYSQNIEFPASIEVKIKEKATYTFSPIIEVYPNANGEYPYFKNITSDIQKKFGDEGLIIKVYDWNKSLEKVRNDLDHAKNDAKNHHFQPISSNINILNFSQNTNLDNLYWHSRTEVDSIPVKDLDYWQKKESDTLLLFKTRKTINKVDYWKD